MCKFKHVERIGKILICESALITVMCTFRHLGWWGKTLKIFIFTINAAYGVNHDISNGIPV